jgi:hypothetical protein
VTVTCGDGYQSSSDGGRAGGGSVCPVSRTSICWRARVQKVVNRSSVSISMAGSQSVSSAMTLASLCSCKSGTPGRPIAVAWASTDCVGSLLDS